MANLVIVQEIMIDAPIELVWRTITEPERISLWWADRVELDAKPGGAGLLTFENDTGTHIASVVVEAVDPPSHFSFRWCHPEGDVPAPGNSMLVEFTLVSEGEARTRLRVAESDLHLLSWADEDKARYAEDHRNGWHTFGGRLATLLAGSS